MTLERRKHEKVRAEKDKMIREIETLSTMAH
jgi:hypothetical protein